jgi:D-serine deaminase-like pyridoxal phosphate-dependent protein
MTTSSAAAAARFNAPGTRAQDLDTPCLVLDLDAMERNMKKMAAYAAEHKVLLRPHAKMHKCAEIARMQMALGAVGVCVQKVSEAEALAAGGINNIFVSNEVLHAPKLRRLVAVGRLIRDMAQAAAAADAEGSGSELGVGAGACATSALTVCCDSVEGVEALAEAVKSTGLDVDGTPVFPIGVLLEIDVGQNRCGAPPCSELAVNIARAVHSHSAYGIYLAGIQAYHGSAQHIRDYAERRRVIQHAATLAAQTKVKIEDEVGIPVPFITGAGSGTFSLEATSGAYGELQCGSYLVMDRDYGENTPDPAHPAFEHALFVASRVTSHGSKGPRSMAVCDAGHKSHAIDSGLPVVYGRKELSFRNGGDEHGILEWADAYCKMGTMPVLNELVWLVPGHCDPTINLHDVMVGIRGGLSEGVVERILTVDARGCLS